MSDPSPNGTPTVPRGWVPARPCPVCRKENKSGWCSRTVDGKVVCCRVQEEGSYASKEDVNGAPFYLHYCADGEPVPDWSGYHASYADRAHPNRLDEVYGRLLGMLGLEAGHKENLLKRGLKDEEIDSAGYRTLPARGRRDIASALKKSVGEKLLLKVPGIVSKDGILTVRGKSGLVIPVRDEMGRVVALKVRADEPGDGPRYHYLSSKQFGGPGPGSPVHVPPFPPADGWETIRITEGELKADVLSARTRVLTLGAPGVALWRPALALAQMPAPKKIIIAFDADARGKPEVARALKECYRAVCEINN
jgi:hypothetical protein